jgi:predicted ester cyclase
MSAEENKAKVRGFYERAVNAGDLSAVDELVGSPEIIHAQAAAWVRTRPGTTVGHRPRAAFPDIRVTVEDFIAEGDKLVNRVTYRGTHTGIRTSGMGSGATGKRIEWLAIAIQPLCGRQDVGAWDILDRSSIWQQQGLVTAKK